MVALVFIVSIIAGGIAAVSGFGIGSLLTPLLAVPLGLKTAVAAVSIPHFTGTVIRYWSVRSSVDATVLRGFGLTSVVGGLLGALMHSVASAGPLNVLLGLLLVFAGAMGVFGLTQKLRFGHRGAWLAGATSGLLGGLVGNQGGIRSAAMLGFEITPAAFVATATAIALLVDIARMPVYLFTQGANLGPSAGWIALSTAGVLIGNALGDRVMRRIPDALFKRIVAAIVLALGVALLLAGPR